MVDQQPHAEPLDMKKLFVDGYATVSRLMETTVPLEADKMGHVVEAQDPTKINPCVDEREKGVFLIPSVDGVVSVDVAGKSVSLRIAEGTEAELVNRETPFPGGKVGLYYEVAVDGLISGKVQQEGFWSSKEPGKFIQGFVNFVASKTDARVKQFKQESGLSFDLPVHIDDHSVEGLHLFKEDGGVNVEAVKQMIEAGLGCGFAKVFMKVMVDQLTFMGETELAQELVFKLGDDLDAVGAEVSRGLLHAAIASGSGVEVLQHGHVFDGITYNQRLGHTFDREASRREQGFRTFVVDVAWIEQSDHPFNRLVKSVTPNMSNGQRETTAVSMNTITFRKLGAGEAPRYKVA